MVDGTINHGNTTRVTGSCDTTAEEIQFKGVSNVSLIGVGTRGVLDQIGIHLRNTSNIIIQNLHVKNVKKSGSPVSNGGDAIGMEAGVNNVWVDHNTLEASGGESSGYDSLLDMKAGVTNVTVSYNHYRNSSRAGLIGSSDSDENDPTATPAGWPSFIAVMTVTPVQKRPSTSRNRRELASLTEPSSGTGTGWSAPNSKSNCPRNESISSWLGHDSAARGFISSGISYAGSAATSSPLLTGGRR